MLDSQGAGDLSRRLEDGARSAERETSADGNVLALVLVGMLWIEYVTIRSYTPLWVCLHTLKASRPYYWPCFEYVVSEDISVVSFYIW